MNKRCTHGSRTHIACRIGAIATRSRDRLAGGRPPNPPAHPAFRMTKARYAGEIMRKQIPPYADSIKRYSTSS
ncbi:hypothetical protein BLAT2472_50005 [Burkholderia latens]